MKTIREKYFIIVWASPNNIHVGDLTPMEMTITWPPMPRDSVTPKRARQGQPTRVREPEEGNRPTP